MTVAIDVRPGKDIERVSAVVTDDGRELEAPEDPLASVEIVALPRSIQHGGQHNFVALVEVRETTLPGEVGRIHRTKVAVEVGGGVIGAADGVVGHQADAVTEALLELENSTLVNRRPC